MNIILRNRANSYSAKGTYDPSTKTCVVKAGSIVSADIANCPTFRGRKKVEKMRSMYVKDNVTTEDLTFTSLSTAANFITGRSSNGLVLWKTEEGISLKKALSV